MSTQKQKTKTTFVIKLQKNSYGSFNDDDILQQNTLVRAVENILTCPILWGYVEIVG